MSFEREANSIALLSTEYGSKKDAGEGIVLLSGIKSCFKCCVKCATSSRHVRPLTIRFKKRVTFPSCTECGCRIVSWIRRK